MSAILATLALILLTTPLAATCWSVPPCAGVRTDSVLFVGTVVRGAVRASENDYSLQSIQLRVREAFAGLPADIQEVTILTHDHWTPGETYLVDAWEEFGGLSPRRCGLSGKVDSHLVQEALNYLRARKHGKVSTSLTVLAVAEWVPVSDVAITLSRPAGAPRNVTDKAGNVEFRDIAPGIYQLSIARRHFQPEDLKPVNVPFGACPREFVQLQSESTVAGLVEDFEGKPIASSAVELAAFTEQDGERIAELSYNAETDKDGRFRFDGVAPGRYHLGTNLLQHAAKAPVPRFYYPGHTEFAHAIPIEVAPGASVDDVVFTLPDVGPPRAIRLCVIDSSGKPAANVTITNNAVENDDPGIGALADLETDRAGCAEAPGYAAVRYRMIANFAETVDIPPGRSPFRHTFLLTPPPIKIASPIVIR